MNTIRVSDRLDPDDVMSDLIWVQTVCKSDQQKTIFTTIKKTGLSSNLTLKAPREKASEK